MSYQIDQSGKIEQTEVDTIIAISNDTNYAIILPRQVKRVLQKLFRQQGLPRMFVYQTFAAMLALIINQSRPKSRITIDREYIGHEKLLTELLSEYLRYLNTKVSYYFEFDFIGKSSPAHKLAAEVGTGKRKPEQVMTISIILNFLNLGKDREIT